MDSSVDFWGHELINIFLWSVETPVSISEQQNVALITNEDDIKEGLHDSTWWFSLSDLFPWCLLYDRQGLFMLTYHPALIERATSHFTSLLKGQSPFFVTTQLDLNGHRNLL